MIFSACIPKDNDGFTGESGGIEEDPCRVPQPGHDVDLSLRQLEHVVGVPDDVRKRPDIKQEKDHRLVLNPLLRCHKSKEDNETTKNLENTELNFYTLDSISIRKM